MPKTCPIFGEPLTKPFQAVVLWRLLTGLNIHGDASLVTAWASWCWERYDFLRENYSREEYWTRYAFRVVEGKKPFPWPRNWDDEKKFTATTELFLDTLQFVSASEPDRLRLVFGLDTLPCAGGEGLPLLERLARTTKETGELSTVVLDAIADGYVDEDERNRIVAEAEDAILQLQGIIEHVRKK